jgi:hypothetical protein
VRFKVIFLALLSFCIGITVTGVAQTGTATISGLVNDSTGASIPAATITVTNVGTQVTCGVKTNDVGLHTVPLLPPGNYQIAVAKEGFKDFLRTGIVLLVDQTSRQDIILQLGTARQTVEVHATAAQFLKPAMSDLGEVITSDPI